MAAAAISVSNLSKTYRSGVFGTAAVQALDGISLEVSKGAIFGLLGPNGAGKTTLIKILLGLVHPSGGTAHLFGEAVTRPKARRRVGYLPENHHFPGFLTAEQALHVYGRLADVPPAPRADRIENLLAHVGLSGQRDSKVSTFSQGMLQRLGIAQALLNDPDLLFLDEPTAGVDPVGRRAIRDLVLELRDSGATIFLNSHLLSEVEKVCSRVAILREGVLVREGSIQELTAVERVYDLVATPIPDAVHRELPVTPTPEADPSDPALRRYRIQAEDRSGVNDILDRLRSAEVEVESLSPVRKSLEDYFIDVLDDAPPSGSS